MSEASHALATQWTWQGLTLESIEETANWLAEPRRLGSGCGSFFKMAGRMLLLARFDYFLMTPVFFHAVIGLERALRIHYKPVDETYTGKSAGSLQPYRYLFQKAVEEGVIRDQLFGEIAPMSEFLLDPGEEVPPSRSEHLAALVPDLRNRYFHGEYLHCPDLYDLTIQLRQCADALKTKGEKSLIE